MIWISLAITAAMAAIMAWAWGVQRRQHDGGWVDAFWSAGTGVTAACGGLVPLPGHRLPTAHAMLVAGLVLAWGVRLALYIRTRTKGAHREDVRYARFRREWGAEFDRRMFALLMIQAAAGALLAVCAAFAARIAHPRFGADVAGTLVLAGSVWGEAVADRQMHRFRSNPANRGGICQEGLWHWSRHPNYFFECLAWCAYPLFALPWGAGWLTLAAPLTMVWLLTKVSGIPPLEREMLLSRGEAYAAYQRDVSALIPWKRPPLLRKNVLF